MNLYLIQHAQARSKEEDPARPLSETGLAAIDKTAKLLSEKIRPSVNVIIHSGKTRAQQTAGILADHINPAGGIKAADGLDPNADPGIWAKQLAGLTEDVMIVGHLPHLSNLASLLLCSDPGKKVVGFVNAGIVCLTKDDAGIWSVRWVITPGLCD